ncbi:UDP-N-acetylglucosamine 1-carboxyvinyltransferase [Membranicola marinus]|uniref:UDP-N-acetylglucosamine 1-carboxyvinyltransferase n=1 Tax=Membranihabitans marinus TaxID=1227546 RepID=A0A953LCU6_9BACT|nr:UDP-N-acetylglucosamine 1-carboxyvinyltransferase [Membranihabitans marinus]MBY5959876.1 UDP-N-acetylglucosamine 1-carboxyvinyltransferase [Membranihabitans marinus]
MPSFIVQGGHPLSGSIQPQGAKNEVLQILSAVLLTAEPVTIHNIPGIIDVNKMMALLSGLGVKIVDQGNQSFQFQANDLDLDYLFSPRYFEDAKKIRGSVMLLGPLLSRFKKAYVPKPGGDKIGRRRIDTHLNGFIKLGATFEYDEKHDSYFLSGTNLKGAYVLMDEISVTGTANMIMTAVLTPGRTTIYNAACEPYVQKLSRMMVRMGARISGIGSNLLVIEGVEELSGTEHTISPDMIEIGSFIGMAAMTGSDLEITGIDVNELGVIPDTFERIGVQMESHADKLVIKGSEPYEIQKFIDGSILTIYDSPWPGFTPDLMSIILVVAIQATGSVLIHQKMFESRLFFVDKLIDMGAQIILCDPHRATVIGMGRKARLRGIEMSSPDIRAGVALLIAALSAEGESQIHNVQQIDRGYQNIDRRLQALGAQIERVDNI